MSRAEWDNIKLKYDDGWWYIVVGDVTLVQPFNIDLAKLYAKVIGFKSDEDKSYFTMQVLEM